MLDIKNAFSLYTIKLLFSPWSISLKISRSEADIPHKQERIEEEE